MQVMHDDMKAWPLPKRRAAGFLFSRCHNLTVTGKGTIDGNGYKWWETALFTPHDNRPNIITVWNSTDVVIENIRLVNAPKFHIRTDNTLRQTLRFLDIHVDTARQHELMSRRADQAIRDGEIQLGNGGGGGSASW